MRGSRRPCGAAVAYRPLLRASACGVAWVLAYAGAPGLAAEAALPGLAKAAVPRLASQAAATDTVHIEVGPGEVRVRQELAAPAGLVEAFAIPVDGQALEILDVIGPDGPVEFTLIEATGARRIAVPSSRAVTLRYRLTGATGRIPLFVAGGSGELAVAREVEEPWLIRVTGGATGSFDAGTSMPRFERLEDGTLEVRLSSLPSFVRLAEGGPLSFARLADVFALLLIALGGVVVFRRLRDAARRAEAGGGA